MPQGVPVVPQDQNGARFYGKLRRQQQTNWAFPASTTTPFSGNTPAGVKVWDAALSYAATQGATPTGEFELAEIHGIQLILANNNSGQTLSGITLQDWDEAPSSGLAIPGQSYSTATNLATGASVTLSALNLASGSAIRLWVPINSASLRFLVVNPTYAAAVTAGTGSLETIAIPEYGTVQLSGSLPVGTNTIGQVVLSGSTDELVDVVSDAVLTAGVNSGQSIVITPPTQQLWELLNLYLNIPAPSGATSGAYSVNFKSQVDGYLTWIGANSSYQNSLTCQGGVFNSTASNTYPSIDAAPATLNTIKATNTKPVEWFIYNATNVALSGTATVRTLWRVRTITGS